MRNLIIFVLCLFGTTVYCEEVEYCWRDFDEDIPSDAFVGGEDALGDPIYVAQIFNTRHLVPANMYFNSIEAHSEADGFAYSRTKDIKVLCVPNDNFLQWIKTTTHDLRERRTDDMVIGGFEYGFQTYIGRAKWNDELLVGKIIVHQQPYTESARDGLHLVKRGKVNKVNEFEVLVYNKNIVHKVNSSKEDVGTK